MEIKLVDFCGRQKWTSWLVYGSVSLIPYWWIEDKVSFGVYYNPANTKHLHNICTTSAQRHRRWSNMSYKCHTNVLCLLGTPMCCLYLHWHMSKWQKHTEATLASQHTRYIDPMLDSCWPSVADGGPTLKQALSQHLVSAGLFLLWYQGIIMIMCYVWLYMIWWY